MGVAAGAKIALRVAGAVARSKQGDDASIDTVLKGIAAAFMGLVLLMSAVVSVLTSPIEFLGVLGDFQNNYRYILPETDDYTYPPGGNTIPNPTLINEAEYAEYVEKIADPNRKAIIETGLSLLGKVGYFWGGKSAAGWNNEWGKQKIVTSPGSKSTGTYRPYGLDCSGYVDWCYKTAGIGDMLSKGGTGWQWGQSYEITADLLQPGDLAFKNPGSYSDNHVGLYLGTDANGNKLFLHCAGGSGVVLNSYSGFRYFRRVPILDEQGGTA